MQDWYRSHCNGIWEHQWGVRIDTLDNPGWKVTIDLSGTGLADLDFPELRIDLAPNDWIICRKVDEQFRGSGDPTKLDAILQHFVEFWLRSSNKTG